MTGRESYLASLVGSWRALAVPHPDARVHEGQGFVVAVFPSQPVLNNALLLDGAALAAVEECYGDDASYAVWTWDGDAARAMPPRFRPDEVTEPMVLALADLEPSDAATSPVEPCDPAVVADVNGLDVALLTGVPGLRTYATSDRSSVAALIEVGDDVNVSMVATRPDARRRGLATAVLRRALADAAQDNFRTSSLQSTPVATGVYAGLGYRRVGTWQEWVRVVNSG